VRPLIAEMRALDEGLDQVQHADGDGQAGATGAFLVARRVEARPPW